MKGRIYSIKTIREKNYHGVEFAPEFVELLGSPEANFTGMFYGKSGSGKSVQLLKLCEHYSETYGKVLYNTHEEGVNKTIRKRIEDHNINSQKLYMGDRIDFELLCKKIKSNSYRMIVLDSVNVMKFTVAQLLELRRLFAKRKLAVVMVAFGTQMGSTRNVDDLLHACDIKVFFKDGVAYSHGRYTSGVVEKRFFDTKQKKIGQPSLFEQKTTS